MPSLKALITDFDWDNPPKVKDIFDYLRVDPEADARWEGEYSAPALAYLGALSQEYKAALEDLERKLSRLEKRWTKDKTFLQQEKESTLDTALKQASVELAAEIENETLGNVRWSMDQLKSFAMAKPVYKQAIATAKRDYNAAYKEYDDEACQLEDAISMVDQRYARISAIVSALEKRCTTVRILGDMRVAEMRTSMER